MRKIVKEVKSRHIELDFFYEDDNGDDCEGFISGRVTIEPEGYRVEIFECPEEVLTTVAEEELIKAFDEGY